MRNKVITWGIAIIFMFSSLLITKPINAQMKPRHVPPSTSPVDGNKVEPARERKDITPKDAKNFKKFLNPEGTYTIEIYPEESAIHPNSLRKSLTVSYPSITDNIAFENTNGTVVSYTPPSVQCKIQNSLYTQTTPPPPQQITKQAESFVQYSWSGTYGIPKKMSITEAKLRFTGGNGCGSTLAVSVHDVGTSWSSSQMIWATRPTMDSSNLVTGFSYNTGGGQSVAGVLSAFMKAYYTGTSIGFGFKIGTQNNTNCGISTNIPALEITYAPLHGGSPSGNDLSFGNGGGNININSWTGATYMSQYDLGFSVLGGLSASFIRTYNCADTVNYGLGVGWTSNLHQTISIDANTTNVTWRTGSGEYKVFRFNGSTWEAPQFTRLTFVQETVLGMPCYTITDKYGQKLCFATSSKKLVMITNRYGGLVNVGWSGNNLTTLTDASTSNALTFTYDQYNRLTDSTDPEGRVVSYTYDGSNRLTSVTDPESETIGFTYDGSGQMTAVTNQLVKSTTVGYANGKASTVLDSINQSPIATIVVNDSTTNVVNVNNDTSTLTWNAYGYVTDIDAPGSVSVAYTRNTMQQITQSTDPLSNSTGFAYDSNGNLTSITSPGSIIQAFTYDSSNNLTSYTDSLGKTTTYGYTNNKLTSVTNYLNQQSTFSYTGNLMTGTTTPSPTGTGTASWTVGHNSYNYPTVVYSPAGREYGYTTDKTGFPQTYTDPMGNSWSYVYNLRGQLLTVTDPEHHTWTYRYNAAGRMSQETDPLGGDTYYTYDDNGRLTKITDDLGHEVEMHRRADGKIDWVEDPMNKRTSYAYDSLGRVTSVTNPTSEVTEFAYDSNSNITSITDPRDKVTTLAYNNLNRLTSITDANNHATTVDYNSNGAITKVTNAQSKYTEFSYDDLNRMWKVKNALGDEWTRSWNDAGKLVSLDAPNTAAQAFVYNIDGLMTNSTDSNAKDQTYEYNLNGNITSVTDPLGNESTFNYDTLNRLTRAYDPQGNYIQNTYDDVGNVTAFRDRRGNSWSYSYDSIYRLASMTDPLSNVTNYVYNDNSKVTQVQKPPQANPPTVNFGYDNASRVNSFTDELNHSASITYTNGLVSSVTDRKSQQFGFSYDDVGLLTQISMPGNQNITFDYDSLNRLTSFTDLVGTTEFTYDDIGRLSTTTDPYSFTHSLSYNSESMITSLTAGTDARTYTWDTSGRMTEATRNSLTTEYTYNDASWVTKIDYPNSTNTNYSYNNRGWMTGIELKDNSNNSIFALPYTYDANGNVTEESVGNDTIAYTYDALNRLTFIDRPGTTNDTTYTYDERGNRTEMETNSITNYLTFNAADELTRVDKPSNAYDTYTYDNNGNCTQMDRYYPQPLLANRTNSTTTTNHNTDTSSSTNTENDNTNSGKLFMTHYPADYAPYPINKWHNLSPYLPDVSQIDPISAKIASMIPEMAEYDRERRWREIAMPQTNPDESTSFTYSSDNNLTHVDLTNGDDLDFAYDGAGRRLEKQYTQTTTNNNTTTTTVNRYRYHYIGSQITTIDIYQTQTTGETTTTTKDDQMRIHLGANTRPISFEYYTKNLGNEQVTSATYYYHYDLHGNVILVTDSSGTTQITYTYDQLGTITSETNTNSIYNPFTYMGEAQIIQDSEFDTSGATPKTGLYASGSSYYNPETGTSLGGSGAPAMTNPSSGSMEEPTAQCTRPAGQLGAHAAIAAVAGGVPSSGAGSSGDVMPEAPYSGLTQPSPASTPTTTNSLDNYLCVDDSSGFDPWDQLESLSGPASLMDWYIKWLKKHHKTPSNCSIGYANCGSDNGGRKGGMGDDVREGGGGSNIGSDGNYIKMSGEVARKLLGVVWNPIYRRYIQEAAGKAWQTKKPVQLLPNDVVFLLLGQGVSIPQMVYDLEFVAWGELKKDETYTSGSRSITVHKGYYLFGYKLKGEKPHFFWGPCKPSWSHMPGASANTSNTLIGKEYCNDTQTDQGPGGLAHSWLASWGIGEKGIEGQEDMSYGSICYGADKYVIGIPGYDTSKDRYFTNDYATIELGNGTITGFWNKEGPQRGQFLSQDGTFPDDSYKSYENTIIVIGITDGEETGYGYNMKTGGQYRIVGPIIRKLLGL